MASPIQARSSVSSMVRIIIWNCSISPRALTRAGTAASMALTNTASSLDRLVRSTVMTRANRRAEGVCDR